MSDTLDDVWKLEHRSLITIGNSQGITIHADELDKLGLQKGDELLVKIHEDGRIVLETT